MQDERGADPTTSRALGRRQPFGAGSASRRDVLKLSAGFAVGGASAHLRPDGAVAQGAGTSQADADLARLQGRRILLKGGVVLTLDRQVGDFARADVLIEAGRISAVRPDISVSEETTAVIDAGNHILVPGFVDTHSHSYQGILRGIMTNGVLDPDYNRDVQTSLTPAFQPADVYAGVLTTAIGLIDMGTTAIVDLSQISHTPEHSDACVRALQNSGIRAVYAYSRGIGPATQYPTDILRLRRTYFNTKDQLLTLALGVGLDAKAFGVAREAGVQAVLHARNASDGLLALGRAGLLRPGDEYIHCTNLNHDAWQLIKDSGGHVSLCPQIEMSMGHGRPAVQEALDHGLRPSLSSDHSVTIAPDFFTVMRTVFAFQRMQAFSRLRGGASNLPPLLTCRDVLEFATIAGARCAGLDRRIGTLTPGKDADIVMLRADRPGLWPLNNAPGAVVNLMNPGDVDTVFIAGQVRKWRGNLVGIDVAQARRMAEEARDAVMRRAGFFVDFLG
jgi:cytosine/adenosine deaminase-related metal-dependent hydrolase